MIKSKELADPNSCLNKAEDDEPIFVLRAKDPIAAHIINHWADTAKGIHEPEKIAEARSAAVVCTEWRNNSLKQIKPKKKKPAKNSSAKKTKTKTKTITKKKGS